MDPITKFFDKYQGLRRVLIFAGFGLLLYLLRGIFNIVVFTFIFTFLLYNIQSFIVRQLGRFVRIGPKIIIVLLYALLAAGIAYVAIVYTPKLITESREIIVKMQAMYKKPGSNAIAQLVVDIMHKVDLKGYIDEGMDFVIKLARKLGVLGLDLVIALLLSLFFQLERHSVFKFSAGFGQSRVAVIYNEFVYFGKKFAHSFGKVLDAQILISLVNAGLSAIVLIIFGLPNVFGLTLMIFILGLIPVAGAIISFIPLSMIAYNVFDGFKEVYLLLGILLVIHALVSYFVAPKLMSAKTDLPIFFVFMVLIIGEKFLGPWGLIIGVPLFVFLLDIFEVPYEKQTEKKPVKTPPAPLLERLFGRKIAGKRKH